MVESQCLKPLTARTEEKVTASWKTEGPPFVSVCCATFNHAGYIVDALNGFLAQVTTFSFEIIIRDDASTDGTTEIVRDYAERYPNIVRAIIEPENQFSKGVRPIHLWPTVVKGKFIAFCEGDDFWVDPLKLQKQVDLLEKYPNAVMSVAKTDMCEQDGDRLRYVETINGNDKILQGFDEIKKTYFHTSTYVIKADILKSVIAKYYVGQSLFGDTALRTILITYGPFVFLPEVVSVYRVTGYGIWSELSEKKRLEWEYAVIEKLCNVLTGEQKRYQEQALARFKLKLIKSELRESIKDRKLVRGIKLFPKLLSARLMLQLKKDHKFLKRIFREYRSISRRIIRLFSKTTFTRKYLCEITNLLSTINPDLKSYYSAQKIVSVSEIDKANLMDDISRPVYASKPQYDGSSSPLEIVKDKKTALYCLPDVHICGSSNLVRCDSTRSVYESYSTEYNDRFSFLDQGVLFQFGDTFVTHYKKSNIAIEKGILLSGNFAESYYHFFYEIIGRLYYIEKFGVDKDIPLIVDEVVNNIAQFSELLGYFNVNGRDIITVETKMEYHVEQLYYLTETNFIPPHYSDFSQAIYRDCFFDLDVLKYLRRTMLASSSKRIFPKRVFLSRGNSFKRRKYNESEVLPVLSKFGFEAVCPEQYSVADQISLFNGADLIVGVTGAALTNIIACNSDCRILCITPNDLDLSIFSTVAKFCSVDLQYYSADDFKPSKGFAHDPFLVSIDDFENKLVEWIG